MSVYFDDVQLIKILSTLSSSLGKTFKIDDQELALSLAIIYVTGRGVSSDERIFELAEKFLLWMRTRNPDCQANG